ncbi:ABC transporter ATP-binding protein [Thalassovita gelatinovora]|nr:ABC transporter ATP-binding protein [Thalassovita gelatinovora]
MDEASIHAVNGVTFDLAPRETYAIVGESGCGKSTVALSLLGLTPIVGGEIVLDSARLTEMGRAEMARVRGHKIAMIFQEPMTSLNPVLTVGYQLIEAIRLHTSMGKRAAREHAAKMLGRVGMSDAERRLRQYPHELSGGMRQRVMIAMALSCNPAVLVADEPTTALDVTVQAQILALIDQLREEFGTAVVLITHDIGVVAETANRIAVMYAGRIVEEAPTAALFADPRHPYTRGLLASVPRVDRVPDGQPMPTMEGSAPSMRQLPEGCPFRARCSHSTEKCETDPPVRVGEGRMVRCWLYE